MIETAVYEAQVGNQVELATLLPHHRAPAVGSVGEVLATALPFGAVTVRFPGRLLQVRPRHLRLLARAPGGEQL